MVPTPHHVINTSSATPTHTRTPPTPPPQALYGAFMRADAECKRRFKKSGTTATFAAACGWELVVASVGDSCAYLDTGREVMLVSSNHRIDDNADERTRILAAGGGWGGLEQCRCLLLCFAGHGFAVLKQSLALAALSSPQLMCARLRRSKQPRGGPPSAVPAAVKDGARATPEGNISAAAPRWPCSSDPPTAPCVPTPLHLSPTCRSAPPPRVSSPAPLHPQCLGTDDLQHRPFPLPTSSPTHTPPPHAHTTHQARSPPRLWRASPPARSACGRAAWP